jgi:hypothetical protein
MVYAQNEIREGTASKPSRPMLTRKRYSSARGSDSSATGTFRMLATSRVTSAHGPSIQAGGTAADPDFESARSELVSAIGFMDPGSRLLRFSRL